MKLNELQDVLKKEGLDGAVIYSDDPNFTYYLQEHLQEGLLYLPRKGKPTVFVHPLEDLEHDFNVVKIEKRGQISGFLKKKKVGYNPDFLTARRYFRLRKQPKLKDISSDLRKIRILKTDQEVKYLKKAAGIADDIMNSVIENFDFRTEGELKRFIKTKMAAAGVEQSFEPIVASEKGAATPHYFGDRKLKRGFLILDLGVKWKGYCSDITRTLFLGTPNKEEKEIYQNVLDVQEECISMSRTGELCSDPYDHALEELGERFTHGLGHGIGVEIHELPNLKPNSEKRFENNMVFTVEPGLYDVNKRIGIRIEDDVLLTHGNPKCITKTTKDLVSIKTFK